MQGDGNDEDDAGEGGSTEMGKDERGGGADLGVVTERARGVLTVESG